MVVSEYTLSAPLSLSIAQVSDLHGRDPRHVLEVLEKRPPDLIAVTGDLFTYLKEAPHTLPFLTRAAAVAPTFYVPGNHEQWEEGDREAIKATGAVLLENEARRFGDIWIGGLTSGFGLQRQGHFKQTPPPDREFLARFAALPGYKLLLCHHPEYYPLYIRPLPIQLTLAGHAHGGQWRLFGQGLFAPGQGLFPPYTSGVYEDRLAVSRGLANTAPFPRLFNPKELIYITLDKSDGVTL